MFSLCIQYGVVPDSFRSGILVPIPKKTGCDTSEARNWRLIVISSTFSKALELYVLDKCKQHSFSEMQFGFVPKRCTNTATSLLNDVISYVTTCGSADYNSHMFFGRGGCVRRYSTSCIFSKVAKVLPEHCWRIMYGWYSDISVRVKWKGMLGGPISIGTRQGGLSSPFLFNIAYQGLIDELPQMNYGICICSKSYNVFCYADDIMLTSLTSTGLQNLINVANKHIPSHMALDLIQANPHAQHLELVI